VVHLLENTVLPDGLKLIHVEYPSIVECESIEEADLAESWPANLEITRNCGDNWLLKCRTALITVPSAIAPNTRNFLLNPEHPDAYQVKIDRHFEFDLDRRLKHLAEYALSYRDEIRYVLPEK
jgi:RES domain-containing protein